MKKSLLLIAGFLTLLSGLAVVPAPARAAETYALQLGQVSTYVESIKVGVTNPVAGSNYYIIVGNTTDGGATCTPDPIILNSPGQISVNGSPVALTYSPTMVPGVIYCVDVGRRDGTELASSLSVVYNFRGQTFSIDNGVPVGPTSPAGNAPNANGCISSGTSSYCMLQPLPGVGDSTGKVDFTSCTVNGVTVANGGFGCYVNSIIKIVIGLVGVLSVIMLIVGGLEVMTTTSASEKSQGKGRVLNAIFGLIIAVSAYAILNTINPNLVNLTLELPSANLTYSPSIDTTSITSSAYTKATGKPVLSEGQYADMAKQVADTLGIPRCGLLTTLTYESQGNPGAIGADENVADSNIKSRRAFIASNETYSGAALPANPVATDRSIKNDDSHTFVGSRLQLDGRFSYGIGLLQITVFPDVWGSSSYTTNPPDWATYKDKPLTANVLGQTYTPEQLLDAQTNITVGGNLWAHFYKQCGQDIPGTWRAYATGSCDSTNAFAVDQANARTDTYNQCVAQGLNK